MPRKGRADTAGDKRRARQRAAAFQTARARLAIAHPSEFHELYREELDKRGLLDHPVVTGDAVS